MRKPVPVVFMFVMLCALAPSLHAQPYDTTGMHAAYNRMVAVAAKPQSDLPWPPKLILLPNDIWNGQPQGRNAFATTKWTGGRQTRQYRVIVLTRSEIVQVIEGDLDRFALDIGHEMAHHVLGHVTEQDSGTPLRMDWYSREKEFAADKLALEYVRKAGFNEALALVNFRRNIDLGDEFPIDLIPGVTHPTLKERLAELDADNARLWNALLTFEAGSRFLEEQQYFDAERCFTDLTVLYPRCHEAYENLGYSLLWQYLAKLGPDDIEAYGAGQFVEGMFFRAPGGDEFITKGESDTREVLWKKAETALRNAIDPQRPSAIIYANLGILYRMHVGGKMPDYLGQSAMYFDSALALLRRDKLIDTTTRAAIMINAIAAGYSFLSDDRCDSLLLQADLSVGHCRRHGGIPESISRALEYNRALLALGRHDRIRMRRAASGLHEYLRTSSPTMQWWGSGMKLYSTLCARTGLKPRQVIPDTLYQPNRWKRVSSLTFSPRQFVQLAQDEDSIEARLDQPDASRPIARSRSIRQYSYGAHGLDIVAASGRVMYVSLHGRNAKPVTVYERAPRTGTATIAVGMKASALYRLFPTETVFTRHFLKSNRAYSLYPDLGLAFHINADGLVDEIIISNLRNGDPVEQ